MAHRFTHFSYRSARLELSQGEILELEKVFSMARFLSNRIVTQLQGYGRQRIAGKDLSYRGLKNQLQSVIDTEVPALFGEIHPAFITAQLQVIADHWERFQTKHGPRPEFKQLREEQECWVLDPEEVKLYQEGLFFPGTSALIRLPAPAVKLIGTPTVYLLRRCENRSYRIIALYERAVLHAPTNSDTLIIRMGMTLQRCLTSATDPESPLSDKGDSDEYSSNPSIIRKNCLMRLISPKASSILAEAA